MNIVPFVCKFVKVLPKLTEEHNLSTDEAHLQINRKTLDKECIISENNY